ncbi:MAG: hypothetical protein JJU37_15780 [Balneolaceae bacterium]|nr:hypothetical protein [Balneolaceae bacterium]
MNFEHIILEEEQKELFIQIVENWKRIPREDRIVMVYSQDSIGGDLTVLSKSSGLNVINNIIIGDLDELSSNGLLREKYTKKGGENYLVSPKGFQYYEWLMNREGKPVERIEKNILKYIELDAFKTTYSEAYKKLKQAEVLLWSSDSQENFTTIGHHCREAMQEFADRLYTEVIGEKSDQLKSRDKNRIKSVIEAKKENVSTTVVPFLEALNNYWNALSDLVQRQEHGGQKEGEPLTWEDARRVVFQTVNVIVELDKTLRK